MTNSVDLRSRRNNGQRRQPVAISAGIVILAAIALVCAGLVAVPLWTALVQGSQVEAISDPCELKDATTLQDCLEKLDSEDIRPKAPTCRSGFTLENRRVISRAVQYHRQIPTRREPFNETAHPRSLYRSYENGPDSPSNPYALMSTLMIRTE